MQNHSVIANASLRQFPFETVSCFVRESVFNDAKTLHE